jgi:glycosyltransferase involved in cell wall biosynthesis
MTSRSTTPAVAWDAVARSRTNRAPSSLRVYMMDLASIVPYYTGHLCAELQKLESLDVTLGSIQYGHDPAFFERIRVATDQALLDFGSSLPKAWNRLRRAVKGSENLLNLFLLALRFLVRKPDVVHVQFLPLLKQGIPIELWFVQFVQSLGIPVVYTVHNVLPHDSADRDREMFRQVYGQADLLICHDQPAKDRLLTEFGIAPEHVVVIPHGPMFSASNRADAVDAREALGLPQEGCLVLLQGIIRPYKGVSFLLHSWKRAVTQGLRGTLLIVGTGEARLLAEIEREVSDLGIQPSVRLEFRFVSLEELDVYYKVADVLVYPYQAVTTSGSLLTGTGYGKPIVATALPAFQEILHDEHNALLVPCGDQVALASALARLANDPELRSRLARELQSSASNLPTWKEIAKQTAHCYARLAGQAVAAKA